MNKTQSSRDNSPSADELKRRLVSQLTGEISLPPGVGLSLDVSYSVRHADFREVRCQSVKDAELISQKFADAERVLYLLPSAVDPDNRFYNGAGYIQHPREAVEQFVTAFQKLAEKWYVPGNSPVDRASFLSRLARDPRSPDLFKFRDCDDANMPLVVVHERLLCIDRQDREWGQQAMALAPERCLGLVEAEWKAIASGPPLEGRDT
ncbi:MAG: hypothetical protein J5J00_01390 [Deltaproteobacteria bacterium]|nr:hypothetical protein [Deltaproteobacteria bacterium]